MPGGHVELGETCEDALVREIKEEVGLDIQVLELLSIQQVIYPKEFWVSNSHFIFFDYLCKAPGHQIPHVDSDEIQATIWTEPEKAMDLNIDRYLRHFLNRLLNRDAPFILAWK